MPGKHTHWSRMVIWSPTPELTFNFDLSPASSAAPSPSPYGLYGHYQLCFTKSSPASSVAPLNPPDPCQLSSAELSRSAAPSIPLDPFRSALGPPLYTVAFSKNQAPVVHPSKSAACQVRIHPYLELSSVPAINYDLMDPRRLFSIIIIITF